MKRLIPVGITALIIGTVAWLLLQTAEPRHAVGRMVLICGIGMALFGLPSQVTKNFREQRCGQPLVLGLVASGVYIARFGYGAAIGSWYLMIPDGIGALMTVTLLFQSFHYPKPSLGLAYADLDGDGTRDPVLVDKTCSTHGPARYRIVREQGVLVLKPLR
jgi:hypothetical protein